MSELDDNFNTAVADSAALPNKPDNDVLLKLYGLFKQGSTGDVNKKRPGFTDMVGRAKWDEWNKLKGTASDAAKQQYVTLINSLK
jgi:diazepam-binding inhibitor (GABA receptor modulator, acyl-CoA-binding protein)